MDLRNQLLSPLFAPTEVLRELPANIVIVNAGLDPYLDEGIAFIRQLEDLKSPVVHKVNFGSVLVDLVAL